jgi:hypothetical protein
VAFSSPAITRSCHAWQWLVAATSAQQRQQRHHQQLTNSSTILKMFTFPENLDLLGDCCNLFFALFLFFFANFLFPKSKFSKSK